MGCSWKSIVGLVQEQAARLQDMQTEIDRRALLKERKTIERAKGVLMNYRQVERGRAYKLIRPDLHEPEPACWMWPRPFWR